MITEFPEFCGVTVTDRAGLLQAFAESFDRPFGIGGHTYSAFMCEHVKDGCTSLPGHFSEFSRRQSLFRLQSKRESDDIDDRRRSTGGVSLSASGQSVAHRIHS